MAGITGQGDTFDLPNFVGELFQVVLCTVRRRIADGSIAVVQPGGPRTRVLIAADTLDRSVDQRGTAVRTGSGTDSAAFSTTSDLKRAGPLPRWMNASDRRPDPPREEHE